MKNILYIEPNVTHQKVILKLISSAEYSAITLKYDFSVKFLLKSIIPSVIIIGHGVPESNTFDLVHFLKNHPTYKNIKLLKLSPSKNKFESIKFLQKGIDEVVNLTEISLFIFLQTLSKLIGDIEELDQKAKPAPVQIPVEPAPVKSEVVRGLAHKTLNDQELILPAKTMMKKLRKAIQAKAIPFIVSEILTLTSFVNSDFNELIKMVKLDPALTVKVLRCANSACYRGNMSRIYSLADAVRIIGMNGLKNLVLGISILDTFQTDISDLRRFKIWYHSIVTGVIAKEIAKLIDFEDVDSMFIMGMLHDIGTSVFDEYFPAEYKRVLDIVYERQMPLCKVENKLLGYDHGQIASYVLESWGFNKNMCLPIAKHNDSLSKILDMNSGLKREAAILKLADILAYNLGLGISPYEELLEVSTELLMFLGIDCGDIEEILENVVEYTNELIQVMFLHIDAPLIDKCNDLSPYKNFSRDPILFYSYKGTPRDYSSYETALKGLNYEVTKPKNLYSIADLSKYKFSMFDFSHVCSPSDYINFFKSIKKDYGDSLKICVIVSEEMHNSIYNDRNLPDNILYLKKPLALKDLIDVTERMS